jgi:hypothetical protein
MPQAHAHLALFNDSPALSTSTARQPTEQFVEGLAVLDRSGQINGGLKRIYLGNLEAADRKGGCLNETVDNRRFR